MQPYWLMLASCNSCFFDTVLSNNASIYMIFSVQFRFTTVSPTNFGVLCVFQPILICRVLSRNHFVAVSCFSCTSQLSQANYKGLLESHMLTMNWFSCNIQVEPSKPEKRSLQNHLVTKKTLLLLNSLGAQRSK